MAHSRRQVFASISITCFIIAAVCYLSYLSKRGQAVTREDVVNGIMAISWAKNLLLVGVISGFCALIAKGKFIRPEDEIRHVTHPLNQRIEKLEAELEDLKRQAKDNSEQQHTDR